MYDSKSPRFFGEDDMMKCFADEKNVREIQSTNKEKSEKTGGFMIQPW